MNESKLFFDNKLAFEREWNKELHKLKMNQKPSLALAIFRIYWLRVTLVSFLALLEVNITYTKLITNSYFIFYFLKKKEAVRMSQPILIAGLLKYFVGLSDFKNALIYSFLLSIGVAINCITHHVYYQVLMRSGMFMRIGLSGLIYKRVIYYYLYSGLCLYHIKLRVSVS
jgi:hypothetical protein